MAYADQLTQELGKAQKEYYLTGYMRDESIDEDHINAKIAYHREMEHICHQAGDFTRAEHHKKMEEIFLKIKERLGSKT